MTMAQRLVAGAPEDLRPVLEPILLDLARGADEPTTRAHLDRLATLPDVTVEGWDEEARSGRLKFAYCIHIGDDTVYIRRAVGYQSRYGPWQLASRPYQ